MDDCTMTQRMIEINSPLFLREACLTSPADFAGIFGHPRPLALEIGCGIGDFIAQLAARQPELNFLAIDIYNKGCLKTCRRLEEAGLNNVRVLRMEARYLLARFVARESLAAVYTTAPIPGPKNATGHGGWSTAHFCRPCCIFCVPTAICISAAISPITPKAWPRNWTAWKVMKTAWRTP
jgi:hypothetical protein